MAGQDHKARIRWIMCGLLLAIMIANYLDRSALGLVEPILKHLLGGDLDPARYTRQYGAIVNCFILAYGVGFLISGRVIDRIGAKRGLAVSMGIWALASIGHAFARSATAFGVARFFLGLGQSGNFPAALKATTDWFPAEERALANGIFNSGTSVASLIAPLLIPWIAFRFGWEAAFLTTGGLSLLALACWQLFPYDRLVRAPGQLRVHSIPGSVEHASFVALLESRATWSFALSKALTDPVWWFYLFWLPKYLHERFAANIDRLSLPLVVVYLGATAGSIGGGWLAGFAIRRGCTPRSGRRLAMFACALCAVAVILVPFTTHLSQAIALLCLATAAHQGWSSNLLTTPSDTFAPHSVASVVGIGGAVGSVGSIMCTALVGVLWANHTLLIFVAGGLAYLTAWAAFQLRLPQPRRESVVENSVA